MSIAPNPSNVPEQADDSIHASLDLLEGQFEHAAQTAFEDPISEQLGVELRRLHARMRIHHAAGELSPELQAAQVAPELSGDLDRLRNEHAVIFGLLDRLIQDVDSIAQLTLEDKEVFLLRGRELIAFTRRHTAEEDRLFYLSVWRDTGGEC